MSTRIYVVKVRDLEDGPRTIRERIPDSWLAAQLADADVSPAGTDDGRLDVTLTKQGREVLVRGQVAVTVDVPCSRTLDPARYHLTAEVFLLLRPAPGSADESKRSAKRAARKAGRRTEEEDLTLSDEDAAVDTYHGDEVALDDFLREFILLEIPMVPLREDLRSVPFEANPSPPSDRPLDPRLSPLAELKARLEKKPN